jgi:hypothetical protein
MIESRNVLVEQWAADNGYELVRSEFRMRSQGPFSGTAVSEARPVYYVQVRDSAKRVRSGWVRFGRRFWGLGWDRAEVRWDDERDKMGAQ